MTQIKCILFDIGGVLVDWHESWITSEISKRFNVDEELVIKSFGIHLEKLDSGKISELDFWKNVGIDTKSDTLINSTESLWDTYFRKNALPNNSMKQLSLDLKQKGYDMGIISNIEKATHEVVEGWHMLDHFDYKFMSYQVGFSKPDSRIYQYVIEKLPFSSEELLFIDDKESNIKSAKKCGISSIHFTNQSNLESTLQTFGVKM